MAGTRQPITVEIDDREVRERLQRLIQRVGAPREAMAEIGEALLNSTRERFSRQSDPEGNPWEPNSEVTLERKAPQTKVLAGLTGLLRENIAYQLTDGGRAVEVGSGKKYAAMQQFGGTKAQWPWLWGDIPARPFLGLSREDRAEVLEILGRYLRD
jgi:phage virion morphogenesis protein